jgi:DNA repair protein RadC
MQLSANQKKTLDAAHRILEKIAKYQADYQFTTPDAVKGYFATRLASKESETFCVAFLDNQHNLIETKDMFNGTIDGASVYPREVVKTALALNSSAVIFSHNHPSGLTEPSEADKRITNRLVEALSLVDIRALDHIIVGNGCLSFAEKGLM